MGKLNEYTDEQLIEFLDKNKVKRCHTNPELLLRKFSRDGVAVLTWNFDQAKIIPQSIKDTCVRKRFYTYLDNDGIERYGPENILALIEDGMGVIINKLINGDNITSLERSRFSDFLITLYKRSPKNLIRLRNGMDQTSNEMLKILAENFKKDISTEEYEAIKSGEMYVKHDKAHVFPIMLDLSSSPFIYNCHWQIFISAKNKSFITSDNPFILHIKPSRIPPHGGVGLFTPFTEKYIPLSSKACLFLNGAIPLNSKNNDIETLFGQPPGNISYMKVSTKLVRGINSLMVCYSDKCIIGQNKELLESLANPK